MSSYIEALKSGDAGIGDIAVDVEFLQADLEAIAADRNRFVHDRLLERTQGDEAEISQPSERTLEYGVALVSAYNTKLHHLDGRQAGSSYDEVLFRDRAGELIADTDMYAHVAQDRHRYMHQRLEAAFGKAYDLHDKDVDKAAKGFGKMYFHRLRQLEAAEEETDPDNLIDLREKSVANERKGSMSRHPTARGRSTGAKPKLVTVDSQQEGEE